MNELRRSIHNDSTLDTKRVHEAVEKAYQGDEIVTDVTIADHLLVKLTKSFLETGYTDPCVLEYVSQTFGHPALWNSAPDNHDFIPYRVDSLESKEPYLSKTTGDLALFNTGFLHRYHDKKNSPIDHTYFRSVGQEAYLHVANKTGDEDLEKTLHTIVEDFDKVTNTLRHTVSTTSMFR